METCTVSTQVPDLIDIVRRWGGSTVDAVLDPHCRIFQTPGIEGVIGYKQELDCAIVFGDPLSSPENKMPLARAFKRYCLEKNWNSIYIIASKDFADQYRAEEDVALFKYGEELYLDPHDNPINKTGVHASLVRRKTRHATREGVTIQEYSGSDEEVEKQIEQVGLSWLKGREGPQIHISNVHLFENRMGKRWFYALKEQKIIGVVLLNELKAHQGWLLNHLMPIPGASNGTPELLIVSVLNQLAKESCKYITFGSVPAQKLDEVNGLGWASTYFAKLCYAMASRIFYLEGRGMFWRKFMPESKPCYLLFSNPRLSLKDLRALMRALNVTL